MHTIAKYWKLFRPTPQRLLLASALFVVTMLMGGNGIGFPLKFLSVDFLGFGFYGGNEFFRPASLLIDVVLWYAVAALLISIVVVYKRRRSVKKI